MRIPALSLLVLVLLSFSAPAADYPQFRGGVTRTGVFEGSPGIAGRQVWKFQSRGSLVGSPVLAGGTIYFGSGNAVHALDREGEERFHFKTGGYIRSTPAVEGNVIYVSCDDGFLYAASASDGKPMWKASICRPGCYGRLWDYWDYYSSSPVVVSGMVVVGSLDGSVYALDASTGKVRWSFATKNIVRSSPAVWDGRVFVGGVDGHLYCLDLKSGSKLWEFATIQGSISELGEVISTPAVAGGVVYFGSRDCNLYALDAKTGKELWRNSHDPSWIMGSPAVGEGRVFVGSSDGFFLRAVEAGTGKEIWTTKTPGAVYSSPALAGGNVYFGVGNPYHHVGKGRIEALDAATGKEKWSVETPAFVWSSPLVDGDMLVVGCCDGCLYAFR